MSVLERYIGELEALHARVAVESLSNPALQDGAAAVAYGIAVGRLEGLRLAQQTLEKLLHEPEAQESGSGRSRSKA